MAWFCMGFVLRCTFMILNCQLIVKCKRSSVVHILIGTQCTKYQNLKILNFSDYRIRFVIEIFRGFPVFPTFSYLTRFFSIFQIFRIILIVRIVWIVRIVRFFCGFGIISLLSNLFRFYILRIFQIFYSFRPGFSDFSDISGYFRFRFGFRLFQTFFDFPKFMTFFWILCSTWSLALLLKNCHFVQCVLSLGPLKSQGCFDNRCPKWTQKVLTGQRKCVNRHFYRPSHKSLLKNAVPGKF